MLSLILKRRRNFFFKKRSKYNQIPKPKHKHRDNLIKFHGLNDASFPIFYNQSNLKKRNKSTIVIYVKQITDFTSMLLHKTLEYSSAS